MTNRDDQNYAEAMSKAHASSGVTALVIQVLTLLAVLDNRVHLVAVVTGIVVLMPFNALVTLKLVPRWGAARAELLRGIVNHVVGLAVAHVAGWPLPSFFWLVYTGVSADEFAPRASWLMLGSQIALNAGLSLYDRVPWIYPLAFAAIAIAFRVLTENRIGVIRGMFVKSDVQRAELDEAHVALQRAHDRLKTESAARLTAERELRQAHKLEAVGRLAAGIAHEINTPLQFVTNSVQFIDESMTRVLAATGGRGVRTPADVEAIGEADLDDLRSTLPEAIAMTMSGVNRVSAIVQSLKEFAYPESVEPRAIDVNHVIRTALVVARHEYKYVAELETDLAPLPPVRGHGGELAQVFVNLLVNAAHAIHDAELGGRPHGTIRVTSERNGELVVVAVSDTGVGIDEASRERIFDPFYTTKEVGRGTGQGLSIARTMIEKRGGSISFESIPGVGSTFFVRLPISPSLSAPRKAA